MSPRLRLLEIHADLDACTRCPNMIGPVVHGPPVVSRILLIGQAPGPREGALGQPFAWMAGRTLFRWFEQTLGVSEGAFRSKVYMAAVARCFPGKAKGGGDRKPDRDEIAACRPFLAREVRALAPRLLLPVGGLAIAEVLAPGGPPPKLADVVGQRLEAEIHGVRADVVALPHPSGASTWHRTEPGVTLLARALRLVAEHPEVVRAFGATGAHEAPLRER